MKDRHRVPSKFPRLDSAGVRGAALVGAAQLKGLRAPMREPRVDLEALYKVRCRFGCDDGVVGIFHAPKGCICWDDPIQALCMQHFITAESTGPIECLVDFRVPNVVE